VFCSGSLLSKPTSGRIVPSPTDGNLFFAMLCPSDRPPKPDRSVSSLKKRTRNADLCNSPLAGAIYLFRCSETGLYAFTDDPSGKTLPSKLYPQIKWRLESRVTLCAAANSLEWKSLQAILAAITKNGLHLTHAAVAQRATWQCESLPASHGLAA
jgi:hypothetical protein